MKILITGGAGCLGASLVDRWLAAGHDLLVIDNLATGYAESLPKEVRFVEGSVSDADLIRAEFSGFRPDCVVHSAAAYKDPDNWLEDSDTNVLGTINVVNASREVGVSRFVNFQTALCYGRPATVPIPVDAPVAPFTSYGISKTAGEQYVLMSGLPAVSLRLANITGPRLAIGPIPTFYQRLKNGQNCFCSDTVRDFLDMRDFLDLADLIIRDESISGLFNVSTGVGYQIKDVFDAVAEYLGVVLDKPVPIVPAGDDDVPAVVLDPSRIEQVSGWKAKISFKEMINDMLRWYDEHGVTAIHSHLASAERD